MTKPPGPPLTLEEKRARVEALLKQRLQEKAKASTLAPVPREGPLPLGLAQERIWFLDRLSAGSSLFNLCTGLRMRGPLDRRALHRAVDALVARHEVLRTRFDAREGQALQWVDAPSQGALQEEDLSLLGAEARALQVEARAQHESQNGFSLPREPGFRITLLKLSPEEHVLLLTLHHLVSDDWSTEVLSRDLAALYAEACTGERAALPPLTVQPADHAAWQREPVQLKALERQLDYWRQRLGQDSEPLALPTDHARPSTLNHRAARRVFHLKPSVVAGLSKLAAAHRATAFMVLEAALAALLQRLTGAASITLGTPVARRDLAALEPLVGLFTNTVVLRTEPQRHLSFLELLQHTRERILEALEHQDALFNQVVEAVQPERDVRIHPLFQVLLTLHTAPGGAPNLRGLHVEALRRPASHTPFDLAFAFESDGKGGMAALVDYSADLFLPDTVERWTTHFVELLDRAIQRPELSLQALVGRTEREAVLQDQVWNRPLPVEEALGLHGHLERWARQTPDRIAVQQGAVRWSYAELNAQANRIATFLRARGVGPESVVGLCVPRSPSWLAALMGIWKAGAAYLPLDPALPAQRLLGMVKESQAVAVVGAVDLPGVVCWDLDREALSRASEENLSLPLPAATLAYVIFTSGSTGTPKGSLLTHEGLHGLVRALDSLNLQAQDVVLQFASPAFDASLFEVGMALGVGAALAIAPAEARLSGEALDRFVLQEGITAVALTPSVLSLLGENALGLLRCAVSGGDTLSAALVERLAKRGCRVFNTYGPTEATVSATLGEVSPGEATPSLGFPLPGVKVCILDGAGFPVPTGVFGELCIGGKGLARGYLGRPELTAAAFVPDALGPPGARLYRTGDQARWLAEGRLEFLGRRDSQVKLRGHRVELGEVEAAVQAHPSVKRAVVLLLNIPTVGPQLCAYVQLEASADVEALRSDLLKRLPSVMVPAFWESVDSWPLNVNGKVDRSALPLPKARAERGSPLETEVERALAAIWNGLLGRSVSTREADFFALGGHSLLITQLSSRIQAQWGVELPLPIFFATPRLGELAAAVELALQAERGPAEEALLFAEPRGEALVPLSFAQERLWVLSQLEPESAAYVIPAAIRLTGALNEAALQSALDAIVSRQEALRARFVSTEEGPRQFFVPEGRLPLPRRTFKGETREAEARRFLEAEAARPFHLDREAPVRAVLARLGADDVVLLVCMHHIVSDAWSMGLFVQELAEFYSAEVEGRPPRLPALTLQMADDTLRQRKRLQGPRLETLLGFWKQTLAGVPGVLALPWDDPRPTVPSGVGAQVHFAVSLAQRRALEALGRSEGATLFMTLMAAFELFLSRHANQDDFCIGTPAGGRTQLATEPLIGFFVNTLAMRSDIEAGGSFRELLRRVRDRCVAAWAHQDLPFERVVDAVAPSRKLQVTPLFQAFFELNADVAPPERLPALKTESFELTTRAAKFDVALTFVERPEGLDGTLEYNVDLLSQATARRWVQRLEILMEALVQAPEWPLSAFPLLPAFERDALIAAEQPRPSPHSLEQPLHVLFEAKAAQHPERVAVEYLDQEVSYGQLNAQANGLAYALMDQGVGTESLVALVGERSVGFLTSILAVFKAGGAYLPLDARLPPLRMAQVLKKSRVRWIVCDEFLRPKLNEVLGLLSEEERSAIHVVDRLQASPREQNPEQKVQPGNLSYVIFTSGSTGEPKGAMLEHRGMLNHAWALIEQLELNETDVIAQTASPAFDISVFQFLGALVLGGRTRIIPDERVVDPRALLEELERGQVTVFGPVPSLLRALLDEVIAQGSKAPSLAALRWFLTSGEVLPIELWRQCYALYPRVGMANAYGPTECSDHSTVDPSRVAPTGDFSPLGESFVNVSVRVLDEQLRPVALGMVGEIYLGGVGVGRGYLGEPARTASAFIPDPYSQIPGARLYRTGDLARRHPDRRLEYLGRRDFQVKIRGFRIELGELESALARHPGVRAAVVVARPEPSGSLRLVAYVQRRQAELGAEELRATLVNRLPEYMVPSAFVFLEAWPLTPNGKLDRRALPEPKEDETAQVERKGTPPRSPQERALAALWEELLGRTGICLEDNFFELGGHSLLAARLSSLVRGRLGKELSLREVFESQTLRALSERMAGTLKEEASLPDPLLVQLKAGEGRAPLFLVHPVLGEVTSYFAVASQMKEPAAVVGIRAPELLDSSWEGLDLNVRVTRYAHALRQLQPHGPYRLGGYSSGGLLAYFLALQLEAEGEPVELLVLMDRPTPAFEAKHLPSPASLHVPLDFLEDALGVSRDDTLSLEDRERALHQGLVDAGVLAQETGVEALKPLAQVARALKRSLSSAQVRPFRGSMLVIASAQSAALGGADLGWKDAGASELRVEQVEGRHEDLVRPPQAEKVARLLDEALAKHACPPELS